MPAADSIGSEDVERRDAAGVIAAAAAAEPFSRDEELAAYRGMLLIRRFEEKAGQFYGMGEIGGFCHLCIGQEAVAVGLQMASEAGDQIVAGHRHHGHMLARGVPPREIMAELTGRSGGLSRGKGGSIHMFAPDRGFYGGHGIVGASAPIGAGLAFANRYRNNGGVCWCAFGDGAADQGQVAETLLMAGAWKLPIVFVIENNRHAAGSVIERQVTQTASPAALSPAALAARGLPYGVDGEQVDGMDVRAVCDAGRKAAARARGGGGPVILEMMTYRYRGHSMADPAKYRSKDEMQAMRERHDPLEQSRSRVLSQGVASEEELRAIDKEIRAIVNDAARYAQSSPEPDARELVTDVVSRPETI